MSVQFALLRHGVTEWNAEKRIQGRSDIGLRADTVATYQARRLPTEWNDVRWFCTPLSRTRQTADALVISPITPEPAWIEMDWGTWEGKKLPDLRCELGDAMQQNEDLGWDFRPDGGESPRDVLVRVSHYLADTSQSQFGVVTHKGVIRAVYAAARGWDMMGKMPDRLDWECLHVFDWSKENGFSIIGLNIPLVPAQEAR